MQLQGAFQRGIRIEDLLSGGQHRGRRNAKEGIHNREIVVIGNKRTTVRCGNLSCALPAWRPGMMRVTVAPAWYQLALLVEPLRFERSSGLRSLYSATVDFSCTKRLLSLRATVR